MLIYFFSNFFWIFLFIFYFFFKKKARKAAFRNIKTIAECLALELINASKESPNSYAIKNKDQIERVAKSNR